MITTKKRENAMALGITVVGAIAALSFINGVTGTILSTPIGQTIAITYPFITVGIAGIIYANTIYNNKEQLCTRCNHSNQSRSDSFIINMEGILDDSISLDTNVSLDTDIRLGTNVSKVQVLDLI